MSRPAGRITVESRQEGLFAMVPYALIDDEGADRNAIVLYTALTRIAGFRAGVAYETTAANVMNMARMGRRDTFYATRTWLIDHGYIEVTEEANQPARYAVLSGPPPVAFRDRQADELERESRTVRARNAHLSGSDTLFTDLRDLEKETRANGHANGTDGARPEPTFQAFWEVYPRKTAKRAAERAWAQATRRAEPREICNGAVRYARDPNRLDEFTAHPSTWLNQDRWADTPLPARTNGNGDHRPRDRSERTADAIETVLTKIRNGEIE